MVFVTEYEVQIGAVGTHVIVCADHLHSGAGGMNRRERDVGKKLHGAAKICAALQLNPSRWVVGKNGVEKHLLTLSGGEAAAKRTKKNGEASRSAAGQKELLELDEGARDVHMVGSI